MLLQQQFWTRSFLEYSDDPDPIDLRALGAGRSLCRFPGPGLASGVGIVCSGLGVRGQCEEQRCPRKMLRTAKYNLWSELIIWAESSGEKGLCGAYSMSLVHFASFGSYVEIRSQLQLLPVLIVHISAVHGSPRDDSPSKCHAGRKANMNQIIPAALDS